MRKKILIIEDNTELLELLRLNLKQEGFSIATANNGVDGLKKARSVNPDLVLLDLVLPEMDGFEVCEALRRDAATAALPVVILSGLNSEFTRFAGMESGATEFVTKPANPGHLVSKIKHLLNDPPEPVPQRPEPKKRTPRAAASIR